MEYQLFFEARSSSKTIEYFFKAKPSIVVICSTIVLKLGQAVSLSAISHNVEARPNRVANTTGGLLARLLEVYWKIYRTATGRATGGLLTRLLEGYRYLSVNHLRKQVVEGSFSE